MVSTATVGAALRCGLTGQPMTDPVVVWSTSQRRLVRGLSYERQTLEQWLRERNDDGATRYGPNTALRDFIACLRAAEQVEGIIA